MRAVFLDLVTLDDLDLSELKACFDELVVYPTTAPEQVAERIEGFDVVILNKVVLDADKIRAATSIKLICVVATGFNNVDITAASERNIPVCNAQSYGINAVAQHTLTLMLALHTRLLDYDCAVKGGKWNEAKQFCLLDFPIIEMRGRTLGIVGYGALGHEVARLAECFGMKVLVAARPGAEEISEGRVSFETVVKEADVLSLHCPLTDATRDLVGEKELAAMKPGAFLINAARGGVVNESALADALRQGVIAGAATDVLTEEPPRNGNVLLAGDIPNLIVTPHSAWGSVQARETIIRQAIENVEAFKAGKPVRCVNGF
ncbi:2-hydroxyacid dehydrogenase [Marinobacterium lutimaris]|uniref:Glycerate dehydrogenase n=1 Tax=Marinobacterium lutimaris TaxID=568106 RepID=A0A1H5WP81_9GAMM|nr:2-hydroxyacid dehydrogenase [Marinobacterium lutimaris]SEG01115.1 glycerate dehydrogenase [Marinobacterium lutimaris]